MRSLFLIPALLLFLSNIPFMHTMDKAQRAEMMKQKGCCTKNSEETEDGCQMSAAMQECGHAETPHLPAAEQCSMQSDAPCVCICFFHYAAPDQVGAKFYFPPVSIEPSLAAYIPQNWKDPMLALPWQPPDLRHSIN